MQRPVLLPGRTLFNPAADQIDFRAGQLFATHIGGRHTNGRIVGRDSPVNFAGARVAGHKSQAALAQLDLRAAFNIQPQFTLAVSGIRTMTRIAFIGEDGADVTVEFNCRICGQHAWHEPRACKNNPEP